ncbi:MAG: TonB-dependent receptor [Bacteroidota bacterium]
MNGGWKDTLITIKKTDWLPSVNIVYSLTSRFNIRAAYYETVARPDLRELSTFSYFDFNILRSIAGSKLQTTNIKNADIRFEYYPSPGEIVSISGFHKRFFNPIELLVTGTSGLPKLEYANLASAEDIGIEVDFRKSLNFLSLGSAFGKICICPAALPTWMPI